MIIAFWIVAALTALVFLAAGLMKLARPSEALASAGMPWWRISLPAPSSSSASPRSSVPSAHRAAAGRHRDRAQPHRRIALAALMIGAAVVHVRRKRARSLPWPHGPPPSQAAVLGFLTVA